MVFFKLNVMKICKTILISVLLLPAIVFGQIPKQELIGIWQNAPSMAAGWSDNYQFFQNGKFVFHYNQMDCAKRVISYSGTWTVIGKQLKLTVLQKEVIEGGKLVEATGSCASKLELVDGEYKTLKLNKPQLQVLNLSGFQRDSKNLDRHLIKINDKKFWKFRDNPNEYE